MATTYKRVLLKLSGEALKSGSELFDFPMVQHVAQVIRQMHELGTEIGIVIGAGNIWRGRQGPSAHMDAVTADQRACWAPWTTPVRGRRLRKEGVDAVVMSAVDMDRFAQPFNAMIAREYLAQGRVVLFGCGSGNPFFSTDTAVALRAIEMQADAILMGKNIDGVYTADPRTDSSATLIRDLTYAQALAQGLKVMDAAAFALCAENRVPMVRVFGLDKPERLLEVLQGSDAGTFVHP